MSTPSQTIGQLLTGEPLVQLGLILFGAIDLWWMARGMRKAYAEQGMTAGDGIVVRQVKRLYASAVLVTLGAFLLLASARLITLQAAWSAFTGVLVVFLLVMLWIMFRGTPRFMLRWLLGPRAA